MLHKFQRRAHHHIANPPDVERRLDWLALIQHHGGPTRLLDFTWSFYVASFFAAENADGDAAVWAVNTFALDEILKKRHGLKRLLKIKQDSEEVNDLAEQYLRNRRPEKLVLRVEPTRLHERLSIQQGLFLMPCDLGYSFEENLSESFGIKYTTFSKAKPRKWNKNLASKCGGTEIGILKIILPREVGLVASDDLQRMNVTSATLFPGLDGFARSLASVVRAPAIVRATVREVYRKS